jgi:hypothetical protein
MENFGTWERNWTEGEREKVHIIHILDQTIFKI